MTARTDTRAQYTFKITTANIDQYEELYEEIQRHLEPLIRLTSKYPVEIEHKDLRYVFDSGTEIHGFVRDLADAIEDFHRKTKETAQAVHAHA
jgi:hypothetical protein